MGAAPRLLLPLGCFALLLSATMGAALVGAVAPEPPSTHAVAGIPPAWVAKWGSGKPVIALG